MLDFPRWKVFSISLVILLGIVFAIPSMLPADLEPKYPTWLPSATINLGLDLAGGSQLLLEADQTDFAKNRFQKMEDQVITELRRSPRVEIGDISTQGGRLSFLVRDQSQLDMAVERLRAISRPAGTFSGQRDRDVQVVDTTRVVMTPTAAGTTRALNDAMTSARDDSPEFAVIDLKMPGRGGLELVKSLHELDPQPKIAVLTGYRRIATAIDAVRPAATYYLTNPAGAPN
jgi:preprotein translocase subunit SecD